MRLMWQNLTFYKARSISFVSLLQAAKVQAGFGMLGGNRSGGGQVREISST